MINLTLTIFLQVVVDILSREEICTFVKVM